MSTSKDSSHERNVENFSELIEFCTGYGPEYRPTNPSIQLAALNALQVDAEAAIVILNKAKTAFNNATNAREIAFAPLKKLATRVFNSLSATEAAQQTVDDAASLNLKLQGKRIGEKPAPSKISQENGESEESSRTISTSQQSFNRLVSNFEKFIETITAEPLYMPLEADLRLPALNAFLTDLKAKNKAVKTPTRLLSDARIARNKILYADEVGLFDISQSVKKYVKSAFGATSEYFEQISGIRFKRLTDKKSIEPLEPEEEIG